MNDLELWHLVIAVVGLGLVGVGTIAGVIRYLLTRMDGQARCAAAKVRDVHDRVDRLQEAVVRKDDLDRHLAPVNSSLHHLSDQLQQLTRRLDSILQAFAGRRTDKE